MPDPIDLAAFKAAAEGATKGPWYSTVNDLVGGKMVRTLNQPPSEDTFEERKAAGVPDVCDLVMRDEDADYLALCDPATLLALVAAVEALRDAERLYTSSALLANGPGCGEWINRTRDVLAPFAPPGARP